MKRFLALFLCLCVLVTVSPVAIAKSEEQNAQSEYVAGEVLIMQKENKAKERKATVV